MATNEPIRIDGLAQFVRSLKNADADLPKMVRLVNNAAVQIVVDDAQPKIPVKTGRARKSIKASSTRGQARIKAGSRQAPYYPWLDFGGRVGRRHSVLRPFRKSGRYLWKSFADNREEIERELVKGLEQLARDAGLE